MLYGTKLKLELYGMYVAIYGILSGIAAFVGWRIYRGLADGQITFGKQAEWLMVRATDPVWFWCVIVWHAFCLAAVIGTIAYFARKMGHGPWRSRGFRG